MEELYSTQDVCRLAEVSKYTACRWAQGRVRKIGKEYLWTKPDLQAFFRRNRKVGRPRKEDGGE